MCPRFLVSILQGLLVGSRMANLIAQILEIENVLNYIQEAFVNPIANSSYWLHHVKLCNNM